MRASGLPVVAVQDAWRLLPWAEVLYGCDAKWWDAHAGCSDFAGEKWSSHDEGTNDKLAVAEKYGLRLVLGDDKSGFSTDSGVIHYGSNSGFQAINMALLFGATEVVLVGFDMRTVGGKMHFFGDHPPQLRNDMRYERFIHNFETAAKVMPEGVRIMNATPGSAVTCFPMVALEDVLGV